MPGQPDYALTTRGLTKSYGSRRALDGLDLSVPPGIVYGFLGPNGAGKTTTMRLLTGLIHPDAGQIELLGRPFARGDRRRLFEVGALIEAPSFYPYLSGRANLREFAAVGAPSSEARLDELLVPDIVMCLPFAVARAATGAGSGKLGPVQTTLPEDQALALVAVWLVGALLVASLYADRAEITG